MCMLKQLSALRRSASSLRRSPTVDVCTGRNVYRMCCVCARQPHHPPWPVACDVAWVCAVSCLVCPGGAAAPLRGRAPSAVSARTTRIVDRGASMLSPCDLYEDQRDGRAQFVSEVSLRSTERASERLRGGGGVSQAGGAHPPTELLVLRALRLSTFTARFVICQKNHLLRVGRGRPRARWRLGWPHSSRRLSRPRAPNLRLDPNARRAGPLRWHAGSRAAAPIQSQRHRRVVHRRGRAARV